MERDDQTRRSFIGQSSAVGAALVAAGGAASMVSAEDSARGRRVIGGSPDAAFSRAVIFDRLVFVSGVVGLNPDTGELASPTFAPQCRQVLENLRASVEETEKYKEQMSQLSKNLADLNTIYGNMLSAMNVK